MARRELDASLMLPHPVMMGEPDMRAPLLRRDNMETREDLLICKHGGCCTWGECWVTVNSPRTYHLLWKQCTPGNVGTATCCSVGIVYVLCDQGAIYS